jgi:2-succinyl-5-enolpyruvyl-6-hydroxy-3-cyclohexene-1-carboxylate synthase
MILSDKKSIQEIVLTLAALGLREVIICPGSRNAPLTISFNRHPAFNCTSIRDERSAGFFALGKALELQKPVAIVCTSGSAALNFAPAIVEAYYLRVPLLVITADRPAEWTNQGDGQTIQQTDIYRNYIRKSYNLKGDAQTKNERWFNNRCLCEGFEIAAQTDPGPVHFNVPVDEPLYGVREGDDFSPQLFQSFFIKKSLPAAEKQDLQKQWAESPKVMILVGQNPPDSELQNLLEELSKLENTIILSESTSIVHHPHFIENIDRLIMPLAAEEVPEFMPDILITIGGAVVSKKIKALLRSEKPAQHWNVHPNDAFMDSFKCLTKSFFIKPVGFLQSMMEEMPAVIDSGYKNKWLQRASFVLSRQEEFSKDLPYSDFTVFQSIFQQMPEEINLHLSNSSPIRYAQLFETKPSVVTHANRGTSGIDGCTSTAMGAASAHPGKSFLLITGDVAFFYDNNAFWNDKAPGNLKIIVINNGGGGIFRIIPGPASTDELEEFFETSQHKSAKKLVEFYEWNYLSADDPATLEKSLQEFFDPATKKAVLEIFTPNKINSQTLAAYWSWLKNGS